MRVLHLTGEHEDAGGVLSVLRNLQTIADVQKTCRFDVWVQSRFREIRRPALNYVRSPHAGASDHRHLLLLRKSFLAFRDVRKVLDREQFDVVHAHTRGTLLVALWLSLVGGVNVVFTNHNFAKRKWLYRAAAKVSRLHSVMLTPNMARHYGISPNHTNVSLISACFSDELLSRKLPFRSRHGRDAGRIRIVGIGNLVRWKNWHLLAEAITRLPIAVRERFVFDHWGPELNDDDSRRYRSELRSLIHETGLGETFRLHGMTTEVYNCLDSADWFALPSTNEPCSVALMEALACGLPAIVSRSGGSVDILNDRKTGATFAPDDAGDLARVLTEIASGEIHPVSAETIRDSVRARSGSAVFRQYVDLYRRWRIAGSEAVVSKH